MRKSFRGGIRFPEAVTRAKDKTATVPFRTLTPSFLRLTLSHRGHILQPCVQVGELVGIGDPVAIDPNGFVPPLHSGLSGTVTALEPSPYTVDGTVLPCLTITSDNENRTGRWLPPLPAAPTREAVITRMYDAGLVGLGGGGYPTHLKYRNASVRHLLINACECEPYLASDMRLCVEQTDAIRQGVYWLTVAAGLTLDDAVVCTESATVAAALTAVGLRTKTLPSRYPQGSERQLFASVFGREIREGTTPADNGALVSNLATAVAMADAARGCPLTHRALSISGEVHEPLNVFAPIGTPFQVLLDMTSSYLSGRRSAYLSGGPMTGTKIVSLQAGLPKTCNGLTLVASDRREPSPCIRCGACVRVCPAGLMPFRIEAAVLADEIDPTASACIACGCCSYVCPAKRQLAHHIRTARTKKER